MARDLELVSPGARAARVALGLYGALIYVFLFGPIVLLVLFSFNANRYGSFPITGWTLEGTGPRLAITKSTTRLRRRCAWPPR